MNIQSIQNKVERRNKHQQNKTEYKDIGTFIKKRRKDLNITQDAVSNGICSISYLSKIENNQIAPNEYFIKEIMTKLEVEDDITNTFLNDEHYLLDLIEAYFYNDLEDIQTAYKEVDALKSGTVHYIGDLIYGIKTKAKNTYITVNRLENIIMNMNDFELKTYLLFTSIYHIESHNHKTALEILQLIESIHYKNDYIDGLYHMYAYMTRQRLLKINTSLQHYETAQKIFRKYVNQYRSNFLMLERIKYIKNEDIILAESLLQGINPHYLGEFECDYNILYADVLIDLNKHQEASIRLNHIDEHSQCYFEKLVLLYKVCDKEQDYQMAKDIEEIITKIDLKKTSQKYRILYHTLKIKDTLKKKEYIRDIAIPYSIKSSDLTFLKHYVDAIMGICIETARYKEATQYYQKYHKELTRINALLK